MKNFSKIFKSRKVIAVFACVVGSFLAAVVLIVGPYRWTVISSGAISQSTYPAFAIGADDCPATLRWHSLRAVDHGRAQVAADGCSVFAEGPWWLDPNHRWPLGAGGLHVLMVSWMRSYGFSEWGVDDLKQTADIRGKTLRIEFSVSGDLGKAPIHFWFQVKGNGARYTNYYLKRPLNTEITSEERAYKISVDLTNAGDFACLGSSIRRLRTYGCDVSVDDALGGVNVDFGLIVLRDTVTPIDGRLELRQFRID